jgi:hypothetical protein
MTLYAPARVPFWVARYRKVLIAAGGFVLEGIALWQEAPAWVIAVGFVTTVLVGAVANEQMPPEDTPVAFT